MHNNDADNNNEKGEEKYKEKEEEDRILLLRSWCFIEFTKCQYSNCFIYFNLFNPLNSPLR